MMKLFAFRSVTTCLGSRLSGLCRTLTTSTRNHTLLSTESSVNNSTRSFLQLSFSHYHKNGKSSGRNSSNQNFILASGLITGVLSSLGIEEPVVDPGADDPLKMTIKKGMLCMMKGDHEAAEAIFHAALKIATDLSNDKAVDYIYMMMAENALDQRDLKKSESIYREVMRRLLSSGRCKENDEAIVEISLHLATIYGETGQFSFVISYLWSLIHSLPICLETGDYEKADEGFKYCIHHQKPRVVPLLKDKDRQLTSDEENSLALYAMILDWFSKYSHLRKNYDLVYTYLKECIDVSKRFLPPSDEQRIILMSDFGVACERIGKLDEAVTSLKEAIKLASDYSEENLGVFLYNLGMVYLKMRDSNNAKFCCNRALRFANDDRNKKLQIKCRKCLMAADDLNKTDLK